MIKIEGQLLGPLGTNCYFVTNDETKEMVIIDPPVFLQRIADEIREKGITLRAILLTHGHYDHAMGVPGFKKAFPEVPVYASESEAEVLMDPAVNLSRMFGEKALSASADVLLEDEEKFELIGCEWKFLLTPGHTRGSGCYYIPERGVLFSGDTLFCRSMGRTDFPTGSERSLFESLRRLRDLPDDTVVYPGHMDATVIGDEKKYNPFMNR